MKLDNQKMKTIYFTDEAVKKQTERYEFLSEYYDKIFPGNKGEKRFFSAPGRTEICGNHTDHNHGKVMAAAVNLDVVSCAEKTDDNIASIKSFEYDKTDKVNVTDLNRYKEESGHSQALLRGVAAGFIKRGYKVGGFNAVTKTEVLSGSGLSSSAAFEVLIGTIFNYLYNDGAVSSVEIAQIAQYAENEYFEKPCGLMDQMACSVGGFVKIDFKNPAEPVISPIKFDFSKTGYKLCIVDTRADHADLTDEYAAIRTEMENAAHVFGKETLRDVDENMFFSNIAKVRDAVSDRAALRGIHFFNENHRVDNAEKALDEGDFKEFLRIILESGYSSYTYNQNVFSSKAPLNQPVSVALSISDHVLRGTGAWRVHGGGFAGTIQAFVPNEKLEEYISAIESVFGKGACYVLNIRPLGGTEVKAE